MDTLSPSLHRSGQLVCSHLRLPLQRLFLAAWQTCMTAGASTFVAWFGLQLRAL